VRRESGTTRNANEKGAPHETYLTTQNRECNGGNEVNEGT